MLTALTLSLALGAPVPAPSAPVATGVAPRVMELKADANGKVMITIMKTEKVQVGVGNAIAPANGGGAAPAVIAREMRVTKVVELGEVTDLIFTTADGRKVEKEDAMKRLASGSIVVVTSDGKPVSPAFLKVFKDDTLVLASPELIAPVGGYNGGGVIGKPGVIRPLPAPLPPIQVQPGVVQILPVQGGIQIEVAQPVPVPVDKTPKPAPEK
ncbi:MAG: hypothetical protein C0467_24725 [Planctomycetaceae bacterium]|nr:hypothetical protein [Planctomycetaceae bacterium]